MFVQMLFVGCFLFIKNNMIPLFIKKLKIEKYVILIIYIFFNLLPVFGLKIKQLILFFFMRLKKGEYNAHEFL